MAVRRSGTGMAPVALLALLGLGAFGALHWGLRTGNALAFPYELDYGEGPLLTQVQRLGRGESLFRPLEGGPWAITNYPPVYHLAVLALEGLGLGLLTAARAVTALATLVVALAAGLLVRRVAPPAPGWPVAVLTGLLVLGQDPIWTWSGVARVDMLALALASSGLLAFASARDDRRRLALCVPLFVLAFFTKQSTVAAAAACFLVALVHRPRLAWRLFALLAGSVSLIALAGVLATDGAFWFHLVTANNNAYLWSRTVEFLGRALRGNELLALLALGGLAAWFPRREAVGEDRFPGTRQLLVAWLVTSLAVGLTVGKVGSNINYLVEFLVAGSALAGAVLAWALARAGASGDGRRPGPLPIAALALGLLHLGRDAHLDLDRDAIRPHRREGLERVLEVVREAPGAVLCEDMTLLALAGKELRFQPFIMTQLAEQGLWDPAPAVELVRAGGFDLVVLKQEALPELAGERFSAPLLAAVAEAYRLAERAGRFWIYVPRT